MTHPGLQHLVTSYNELVELHGWAAFRTPRNMALALTGRVGAVAAALQFADDTNPPDSPELRAEVADCLVYLVGLSRALGFDVLTEAEQRIDGALAADRTAGT